MLSKLFVYIKAAVANQPREKINLKIVITYLALTAAYIGVLFLSFSRFEGVPLIPPSWNPKNIVYPPPSPLPYLLYMWGWPILSGLIAVILSKIVIMKMVDLPQRTITTYQVVNNYFFAQLVSWLVALPLILLSWLVMVPLVFSSQTDSMSSLFNITTLLNMLYPWFKEVVFGIVLVSGGIESILLFKKNSNS